jgi:hypothetical protein
MVLILGVGQSISCDVLQVDRVIGILSELVRLSEGGSGSVIDRNQGAIFIRRVSYF